MVTGGWSIIAGFEGAAILAIARGSRHVVLRTPDGLRFEVVIDDGLLDVGRQSGGLGELVRTNEELGEVVQRVMGALARGMDNPDRQRPDVLKAEFGITLDADAGFVVSAGTTEAHIVVSAEFNRSSEIGRV